MFELAEETCELPVMIDKIDLADMTGGKSPIATAFSRHEFRWWTASE